MNPEAKLVLVTSIDQESAGNFIAKEARQWVAATPESGWNLTREPARADLILFLEHHPGNDPLFLRVLLHPWRRHWPEKCFLYHDADFVYPLMRGIYPALEKRFLEPGVAETWFYVTQNTENSAVEFSAPTGRERYLFSFVGAARTNPIRPQILQIQDDRAFIQNIAQDVWQMNKEEQDASHRRYAEIIRDSKFVLCPRGFSPTSYRLLETMKAARCPVIIGNDWSLPVGPSWSEFVVFVPDTKLEQISDLLRDQEDQAVKLGLAARAFWENWCVPQRKYERLLDRFVAMGKSSKPLGKLRRRVIGELFKSKAGLRALWHSLRVYSFR